jgi:hypothetical protein
MAKKQTTKTAPKKVELEIKPAATYAVHLSDGKKLRYTGAGWLMKRGLLAGRVVRVVEVSG